MKRHEKGRHDTVIIHLGDHDPSGLDMTRDIQDRLQLFGSTVNVDRIALTWDQIEQYNPPPNPAKTTDARYASYQEQYGDDSWELDALEPRILSDLIRTAVQSRIDDELWQEALERQQVGRDQLSRVSSHWDSVVDVPWGTAMARRGLTHETRHRTQDEGPACGRQVVHCRRSRHEAAWLWPL